MTNIYAQSPDRSKKPEPLTAKEFIFPPYSEHVLKNGLKVFIIENHNQPVVSMQLLIPGGTSMDTKIGTAEMVASLLTKGTKTRKALDIATTIDGVGSAIYANASTDYTMLSVSGLKKHWDVISDLFKDVLLNPSFPVDELDKLKQQEIASIQYDKSQPSTLASNIARKAVFGDGHPYAYENTEKSVMDIDIKAIKDYYAKFYLPNHSTIAVVGDVDSKKILDQLEKLFADWKKGKVPQINLPKPEPKPLGVYFIHRPASEQSTVVVTNLGLPVAHKEYEYLQLAANVIGSGFSGRLFRTLREKYSYTYSPWGYLTTSKFITRFACGADVKQDKTDSSIAVILEQIKLLGTEGPTNEELDRLKRYLIGQYNMSLEKANVVASIVQTADFYGKPIEEVKDYPNRLNSISNDIVEYAADNYLRNSKSYIVVVGDPSIRSSLEKFGKVFDFNLDLEPISGADAKLEKISLSPEELIKKHRDALGADAIDKISSIRAVAKSQMNISGQILEGDVVQETKLPAKLFISMDMKMFKQDIWFDGVNGGVVSNGSPSDFSAEQLEKIKFEANLFNTTKLLSLGYKVDVKGKLANEIVVLVTSPSGKETTYYFDANSFLISKYESLEDGPEGPTPLTVKFDNWISIDGVKLPGRIENNSAMFIMTNEYSYELNAAIDDSRFAPQAK